MTSYGSDYTARSQQSGDVVADGGATIISPFSEGEAALLAGPALLREIQAGVANGSWEVSPQDPTATISDENNLPYWSFTDINSGGAITCAIVSDATAGSGNILEWRVAASTTTGKSAKLTRFVPVASTKNRAYAYSPEVNTSAATATTTITMRMQAQYYRADQTTTTGTAIDSGAVTFTTLGTGSNWLTGSYTTANAAPSDAAFCLITITVATAGTTPASVSSADITEVRLIRGDQTNLFAEYTTPATYAPTLVRQVNGTLQISPNAATGAVQIGGNLNFGTAITVVPATTALTITRNDTGNRANIVVGRIFAGDQTTRFISDDGTRTTFSAGIDTAGSIVTTGSITNDGISTTTQTASAAIWVLSSGTTYTLRRNSSSARYKTNIVDADEAVLEAARKIQPRHYESTIEDEAGATRLGFIAEEVEAAGLTHAVGYDAEGRVESLDATALIAALFVRVNDLEQRLADLESR
jgi:hypothetical protein